MTLPLLELLPSPPPRAELGTFPSPTQDLPHLSAMLGLDRLLVKRDDLNGTPFGGNKLRALEWLLPAAGRAIVTMGGYGSSWCAALAVTAAARGQRAHVALFPQPWSDAVARALSITLANGHVALASARWSLPLALARAWRTARTVGPVTWLPAGGATPLAVLGTVNASLELAQQIADDSPPVQAVVVPLGSGGTAAGLLVGAWIARWDVEICAVRVTDPWFANHRRVMSLAARTVAFLRARGLPIRPGAARLRVLGNHLGAGYGHPTREAIDAQAAMAAAGIALELTYGAKAFAGLQGLATCYRRLCFWHTFDPRLTAGAASDHPLLPRARLFAESLWPLPKST